jgi:hypothetical protein
MFVIDNLGGKDLREKNMNEIHSTLSFLYIMGRQSSSSLSMQEAFQSIDGKVHH